MFKAVLTHIKQNFTLAHVESSHSVGGTHKGGGYISTQTQLLDIGFAYGKTININGTTQSEYISAQTGLNVTVLEIEDFISINRGYSEYDVIDTRLLATLGRLLPSNQAVKDVTAKLGRLKEEEAWITWREYSDRRRDIQREYLSQIKHIIKGLEK